ncbi:MAG: hypothetical protein ACREHG_09280, partial [Candidatus Saccharimonadales bacterium]
DSHKVSVKCDMMLRCRQPLPPPSPLPFDFSAYGWEDANHNRHRGKPSELDNTMGIFVDAKDRDTGEQHMFWAFIYRNQDGNLFQSWEQWLDYIAILMTMHGMELG